MQASAEKLRADVECIWRAGVAAVLPERLVPEHVRVDDDWLVVGDDTVDLRCVERIAIVGAGKAAGAMAIALEHVLGPQLLGEKNVIGWINVPADCVAPAERVHLHAARPAGVNEPRPEGVEGTRHILAIVSALGPRDLCFCLLTGGGSALLPAPVPEISLAEKIRLTKLLSAAGANIEQLNTVRSQVMRGEGRGAGPSVPCRPVDHAAHLRRAGRSTRHHRVRSHRSKQRYGGRRAEHSQRTWVDGRRFDRERRSVSAAPCRGPTGLAGADFDKLSRRRFGFARLPFCAR